MRIPAVIGCAVVAVALAGCSSSGSDSEEAGAAGRTTVESTSAATPPPDAEASTSTATSAQEAERPSTGESASASLAQPNSAQEAALQSRATELSGLIIANDAPGAWSYYSPRCQQVIGSVDAYAQFMALNNEGRDPQVVSTTATVDGDRGEVVTIDEDPNAPEGSAEPRAWTRAEGVWQFDNC